MEYPETAVIVMTAFGSVKTAVEAIKAGAYDYIAKPINPDELNTLVSRSIEHRRLARRVLRSSWTCLDRKYGFEEIIGSSPALLEALDVAARWRTDVTVLLNGETGTGKELVAKAIHMRSNRREQPFMTINCGAIPRELLESELFGHLKGAFTGALTHKKGRVEMADRGTILLDEIGEMPLELQVRIRAASRNGKSKRWGHRSNQRSTSESSRRHIATWAQWSRKASFARISITGCCRSDHRAASAGTARRYPRTGSLLLFEYSG